MEDLSETAAKAIAFHSLKHSSCHCIGVLISNGSSVVAAIPLFHAGVTTPVLDTAFLMIKSVYLAENPSHQICGLYEAPVLPSTSGVSPIAAAILEKLETRTVVKVTIEGGKLRAKGFEYQVGGDLKKSEIKGLDCIDNVAEDEEYLKIVDFDDHLSDPELDWRNPWL